MFQRLCTFQHTGVLIFGVYVLSGHCSRQQILVKNEGVLIFGGYLGAVANYRHFVSDERCSFELKPPSPQGPPPNEHIHYMHMEKC